MGCTSSSAPNVPTPLNSVSEKNVSKSEDEMKEADNENVEVYTVKEKETKSTIVLPTCDNETKPPSDILAESPLDRNNKSFIQLHTLDSEPDRDHENDVVIETDDNNSKEIEKTVKPETETLQTNDKITTLEEAVEKAVEFFVIENTENIITENAQIGAQEMKDTEGITKSEITHVDGSNKTDVVATEEETEPNTETELEVSSPSQSHSSRATRWEALADIAAELPPSLAVDPLTGQIYALTK